MADDENKKTLGYQPNIEYVDDYYSDHTFTYNEETDTVVEDDPLYELYDNTIAHVIQGNIDNIVALLEGLPEKMQTAVNQVFKPIYNEWYNDLIYRNYPVRIPDPDIPIVTVKKPTIIGKPPWEKDDPSKPGPGDKDSDYPGLDGGEDLGGGDDPGSGGDNPSGDDPGGTDPGTGEDPGEGDPGNGGTDPGEGDNPWDPGTDPGGSGDPERGDPNDPWDPNSGDSKEWEPGTDGYEPYTPGDIDEGLFDPDTPFSIDYEYVSETDIIDLEYAKNLFELYQHYTNNLNDILSTHMMNQYTAYTATQVDKDFMFLSTEISIDDVDVEKDYKHLIDMGLRNEVLGNNKLDFSLNAFPVESTLYHLKNLKTSYNLRLRYAGQDILPAKDGGSMSNAILRGAKAIYSNKYEVAYINLYKYLNSQTKVLADVFKTFDICLKAKETLIKKGGYKK